MHPALLDAAFQASFFLLMTEDDTALRLPFALAELALYRPGATPSWAWLRRAAQDGQLDIDLCDEQGNMCIRCTGLSFRARTEPSTTAQTLLLEPYWEAGTAGQGTDRFEHHLVVLGGMHALLQQDIEARIEGCRCLRLADTDQPMAKRFQQQAVQVFATLRELLTQPPGSNILLQVVCPTQGAERLLAALAGLLHIARQEHSGIRWQIVEVDRQEADLVARLQESRASLQDTHVRYLDGQRQVVGWRALDSAGSEAVNNPWKDGGTYLITGGLGGLGVIFAREIATQAQDVTLILVGRSARPQDEPVLEELRQLGARVQYRQVDVAAADQVNDLIRSICAQADAARPGSHGPLQGILHSAGVHHDNRISKKTAAEFTQVLAPKVAGTVHLDRATRDLDLDFFVLFSSIAVTMGNPGQADYATANAFMDAYATWRNNLVDRGERRGHTLSINWPLWQEGRMRADRDLERLVTQRMGLVAMASPVGIRALRQALALGKDQVMVLHGEARKLYATLSAASPDTPATPQLKTLPDAATSDLRQQTYDYLKKHLAAVVELPAHRLDVDAPLTQYGFDSILLMKMTSQLEATFGTLAKTLLFEYQSISELTTYFLETHPDTLRTLLQPAAPTTAHTPPPGPAAGVAGNPAVADRPTRILPRSGLAAPGPADIPELGATDIAVIACTGRYPQAATMAEFWDNLKNGKDCITDIPSQRWDHQPYFDADQDTPGKTSCAWGGFIDGVDQFDPLFFNISPREAALMDPQERLFLETVWHLFEEIGYTRQRLQQRYAGKVGVFVGAMYQHYHLLEAEPDSAAMVSLASYSAIANRVSSFFDFQGPSLALDTMCSSSLTAVHLACQSLLQGECALAVAGGVNLSLHPKKFVGLSRAGIVASQRQSKSFGDGDGYLPAEGVGAVLLKPLAQALRDGNDVLAVIKSTATNHSGYATGFSVPNPKAQAQLLIDHFNKAGIDPRTISYVEAAANGSALGDALEVAALNTAFARFTPDRGFCAIGAVKSNIGHPEAASGMAQLAKVLLQLRHAQLVPSINATPLNPEIRFADTAFYVQDTLSAWQRPRFEFTDAAGRRFEREVPRRAAINSFGAGGSNVHLIIEEYVSALRLVATQPVREATPHIMVLSAKNPLRLQAVIRRMLDFLVAAAPAPALADLAYTLQVGREAMPSRLAMVIREEAELFQGLAAFLETPGSPQAKAIPLFMSHLEEEQGLDDLLSSEAVRQVFLNERNLEKLALYWTRGGDIPWETLHQGESPRLLTLPTYPFARDRYWLAASVAEGHLAQPTPADTAGERAEAFVRRFLVQELHLTPAQIQPHRDLRDYGADSITAMRFIRAVAKDFQVKLSGRDLLEHHTVQALATYLAARMVLPQAVGNADNAPVPPVVPDALDQFQQGLLTLQDMEALLHQQGGIL